VTIYLTDSDSLAVTTAEAMLKWNARREVVDKTIV
jgi:hypothetical protein